MNTVAFSSWNGKIVDNRKGGAKTKQAPPLNLDGRKYRALMAWNGLVVIDPESDITALTVAYLKEARGLSCGECSVCMIGIERILDILEDLYGKGLTVQGLAEIEEIVKGVTENGKCNFGRSCLVPVADAVKYFKADFQKPRKKSIQEAKGTYAKTVTAPCMQACPATLDIPGYIELIKNNRFRASLDLIREKCILPGVIGRACTHPCESACVRNDVDEPLAIRLLKRAAADEDLNSGASALSQPQEEKKERIAVVGAGPAGLAAAYHLRRLGYQVTIFEALPKPGGMAAVGIPDYRLPKDILNHEINLIKRTGVDIKLNSTVEKLDWSKLVKEGYAAVFVAVGAHVGTKMGCKGEEIASPDVVQGAEFLRHLSLGGKVRTVKKVVIIGGGNVALDCARSAVRLGFGEVEIVYRRSPAEMPGSKEEIEEALHEGVKFTYLTAPVGIIREKGEVKALECIKMELGEPDESGRRRPIPIKGSEFLMETQMVIAATGQKPDLTLLTDKDRKAAVTAWGTLKADAVNGSTPLTRIFAGGDCVSGPATLIEALNMGNRAARGIDAFLRGATFEAEPSLEGIDTKQQRGGGYIQKTPAAKPSKLEVSERLKGFGEVEGGFSTAEAVKEAQRCLRCYRLMVWE